MRSPLLNPSSSEFSAAKSCSANTKVSSVIVRGKRREVWMGREGGGGGSRGRTRSTVVLVKLK